MNEWTLADLPKTLAKRTTIDPVSSCWRADGGYTDPDGYAYYGDQGAHRYVYTLLVGPIPAGLQIDHVLARGCVWRCCIWPVHLQPVPARVNTLRGRSFAAVNAAKDECDHGHAFDLLNTYYRPDGSRDCRACIRRRVSKYKQRLRAGGITLADLGRAA